jgi:hypothetical protein
MGRALPSTTSSAALDEKRGKKRDHQEAGRNEDANVRGDVEMINGEVGVNGVEPKAVLNAMAGMAGVRPRPIKKQRMVSHLWACITPRNRY